MLISAAYYLRSDMALGAKTNFPPESYRNAVPARLDVLDFGPRLPDTARNATLYVRSPARVLLAVCEAPAGAVLVSGARLLAAEGRVSKLIWSKT